MKRLLLTCTIALVLAAPALAEGFPKPYDRHCTERENVFEFAKKPSVRLVAKDKYEIVFATKGYCDVTAGIIDEKGVVVRHLASGVLGKNAPTPFQKDSLEQKIYWNGKDDLDVYVKEPEKLRVQVRLGLKPVFHKLPANSDARNLPGDVIGLTANEEGVYVFSYGKEFGHTHLRTFDHDGEYVASLAPPPSNLPEKRLHGRTSIEYESGKRAHHGPVIVADMGYAGNTLPGWNSAAVIDMQPVVVGKRILYCEGKRHTFDRAPTPARLFYVYTDGSTDLKGMAGREFITMNVGITNPRLAASPDGKRLYFLGVAGQGGNTPVVLTCATDGDEPAKPFVGVQGKRAHEFNPGSDEKSLNNPVALDCDPKGRVYVADQLNNRIQVFSPEGKLLKTIPVHKPRQVCIHKKTGAIYVQHVDRVGGLSVERLSRFGTFDAPKQGYFFDGALCSIMTLDSWAPKPRIWIAGGGYDQQTRRNLKGPNHRKSVMVWEDDGKSFRKVVDFDEEVKKAAGDQYIGRWSGGSQCDHVACDPTREELYFRTFRKNPWVFDLPTGKLLRQVRMHGQVNDIAFDKRGYMHVHFDPGFFLPGVVRLDPGRPIKDPRAPSYPEVPYDYGVEGGPKWFRFLGMLPVKDQPGAKYFQDGLGVNMAGNVAVQSYLYYIPKMEDESYKLARQGATLQRPTHSAHADGTIVSKGKWYDGDPHGAYLRRIAEKQKRGEEVYFIKRRPGIPLAGGTVWTFDRTGEIQKEPTVIAGGTMRGVQIDEDNAVYFVNLRGKMNDGKPFLHNRGSNIGASEPIEKSNRTPVTGTLLKTKGKRARLLLKKAVVPMDPPPTRPTDLVPWGPFGFASKGGAEAWTDGVEWMYSGITPAVPSGCTCPNTRFHLDWYKRTYVPEAYRHAIGILDTNGNLIMHVGRYGNLDDVLAMKPGATNIGMTLPRYISGTDNYLAFNDWGERLVVLKLDYHAEETVPIKTN
ncbi:hypothetical protein ACFL01_01055 [Planctomycetota bacterium]